jgi:hypothetical protein
MRTFLAYSTVHAGGGVGVPVEQYLGILYVLKSRKGSKQIGLSSISPVRVFDCALK